MCLKCDKPDSIKVISHQDVPVKIVLEVAKMIKDTVAEGEPVFRKTWYRTDFGSGYACQAEYRYFDGYQMTEDMIEFIPSGT